MARTATKTKSASGKPTSAEKKQTKTTSSVDELAALAVATKDLSAQELAKEFGQATYIKLVSASSGEVSKGSPAYMEGVKTGDYVISSKRLLVSNKQVLDATVIGMFKLYAEKKEEPGVEMKKTVKYWLPDDALQYPTKPGNNFERVLPNSNTLVPIHWVFLYMHDHPDIEDGRLIFQSKGNSVYSELVKMIKAEASVCTELRFKITNVSEYDKAYKKTNYYPKFEISGHNYKLVDDKITKTKDSKIDAEELKTILERSAKLHKDFAECKIVSKQALLSAPTPRAALPAAYEDEDGEETLSF